MFVKSAASAEGGHHHGLTILSDVLLSGLDKTKCGVQSEDLARLTLRDWKVERATRDVAGQPSPKKKEGATLTRGGWLP
jgi:hypothetical protein